MKPHTQHAHLQHTYQVLTMFAAWPQEARRRIERLARVLSSEIPSSTEKIVVQVEENTMTLGQGMQRQPWPYTGDAWFCCPQICHWKYFGVYRNLVFLVSPWPIWTLDVRYVTLTKKWYAVSHSRTTLKCGKRQVQLLREYFAKLKSFDSAKGGRLQSGRDLPFGNKRW